MISLLTGENAEYGGSVFSSLVYFKTDIGNSIRTEALEESNDFSIYPTIVEHGAFQIRFNKPDLRIDKIDIYDMTGRVLFTDNTSHNIDTEIVLSPSQFELGGAVFVRIRYNKGTIISPIFLIGQK